jgi:hypothetical protein
MKYLILLIIILIIIFSYILLNFNIINNNTNANIEKFESNTALDIDKISKIDNIGQSFETILSERQDYKMGDIPNIEDPISDAYLPYSSNIFNQQIKSITDNTNEYEIINIYKSILQRQPNSTELNKNLYLFGTGELNEVSLKKQLLNSPEYLRLTKMQSNDVESGLEGALAKEDLLTKLTNIYYEERKDDCPRKMILPLRDTYIHLQYNDYLYRAVLRHNNYPKYERDILDSALLTKEKLLEIFNKYFDLTELKLVGNDIRKEYLLSMKNELGKIPEPSKNKNNGSDINDTGINLEEQLNKILKNSNNIFDKDKLSEYLDNNKYKSDLYMRVYDPINYKQHYRGEPLFRPPICTSLGQQQKISPVFTESKMLFQGTPLEEAANTQVGSIMPKFEYKEYQDINVV